VAGVPEGKTVSLKDDVKNAASPAIDDPPEAVPLVRD
jgi:hypothetical protein